MPSRQRILDPGPVWVYLVSFGALFLRFGYDFGAGDQDELVPFLSSILDRSLFLQDWFVQTQAAEIGVRTYVVGLLVPFCRLLPMQSVFFGVYLLCWILIGSGAFRVARRLIGNDVAAALAVFFTLGVFHKWTLGSNDLVYSMFVGEMISWGLALHALDQWLERHDRSAAVLLGVATWFQLLVGLLVAGVLVVERVWHVLVDRTANREQKVGLPALGLFILFALPSIVPIALQQVGARSLDSSTIFYILARFRNPFHHLFFSFGAKSITRFVVMLAFGAGALVFLRLRGAVSSATRVTRIGSIILAACFITLAFTEIWPVLLVAKFQAFKLTVVLKYLLLVLLSGALIQILPADASRFFERFVRQGRTRDIISLGTVLILISLALIEPAPVASRLGPHVHAESDLGRMESWILRHTDRDAVFAVPPSNSTFRSSAHRAVVINYQAFPFDDADMVTWYIRLMAVAPIDPPRRGLGIKPALDAAYYGHTVSEWKALRLQYGIDFLLVEESRLENPLAFEPVHVEGTWTLLRLTDS